ncbi:MAG TPA: protein-L-isoaspartate O-methyltransferase [Sphingomicrobium sp.]
MTIQRPIPDYVAARQAMVDSQLRPQGVNDPLVVEAMASVPRELFVPEELRPLAYADRPVPLGGGRSMSPAVSVGLLLTALAPRPGQRALIVGAGTGYCAALLSEIGLNVVAVESDPSLAAIAAERGLQVHSGSSEEGYASGAPYDLVLVDGAVEHVPDALVDQLRDGGSIGYASIDRGISRLVIGRKSGGAIGTLTIADSAVAPLPGFTRPRAFTF